MSHRRWTALALVGAAVGVALVVLVHQPFRMQRCAVQAVAGPSLSCEDRRVWDWPDWSHMAAAAAVGALLVGGFAWPFVDRR